MLQLMVPWGGCWMMGRGQSKEGLGGGPITYPTDVPFGYKNKPGAWYDTSPMVGPKRLPR
jgi:hypothetical protein